jgi:hypothetical protein
MKDKLPLFAGLCLLAVAGCQPAGSPTAAPVSANGLPVEASAAEPLAALGVEASGAVDHAVESGSAAVPTVVSAASSVATVDAVAGDDSEASGVAPAAIPRLYASDLTSLRSNHSVANEGASCSQDNDCDSPLRCIDALCAFPPAMTGYRNEVSPRVTFTTADGTFEYVVELAMTSPQQQRGLMHRHTMVADAGMIFVFSDERPRSFWMRNTLIHLDMVFVRADGVVDSIIVGAEPLTEVPRPSEGPARFVIELNAGQTMSMGLRAGDRVSMQNVPL